MNAQQGKDARMQWAKTRVGPLLIAVALFLSFRYFAEFSLKQCMALTVSTAVAWGLCIYLLATRHVQPPFQPFYVRVVPNWYELLRDHKLIRDGQDWQAIQAEIERAPTSEFHVVRNGIMFTVLKAEAHSFWPSLVYSNDHRNFLTKVDLCEPIDRIGCPELCIKWGAHGYELGLTILNIVPGGIEPRRRLVVATIPYEEICIYWYRPELLVEHWEKFKKRRDQLLVENGWKRKDVGAPGINVLEHKYFTVWHEGI